MTLQNVRKIKGAADKNGLKTLCVNKVSFKQRELPLES